MAPASGKVTWKWVAGSLASVLLLFLSIGMSAMWGAERNQEVKLHRVESNLLEEKTRSVLTDIAQAKLLSSIDDRLTRIEQFDDRLESIERMLNERLPAP